MCAFVCVLLTRCKQAAEALSVNMNNKGAGVEKEKLEETARALVNGYSAGRAAKQFNWKINDLQRLF